MISAVRSNNEAFGLSDSIGRDAALSHENLLQRRNARRQRHQFTTAQRAFEGIGDDPGCGPTVQGTGNGPGGEPA